MEKRFSSPKRSSLVRQTLKEIFEFIFSVVKITDTEILITNMFPVGNMQNIKHSIFVSNLS